MHMVSAAGNVAKRTGTRNMSNPVLNQGWLNLKSAQLITLQTHMCCQVRAIMQQKSKVGHKTNLQRVGLSPGRVLDRLLAMEAASRRKPGSHGSRVNTL